ncbi:MAG TPA: hypothetical protein EYQ73_00610 [Candidatus Poseidoniales archaeon]|nr:hypothetical protein [Candidatus Poseidoniales archaeon]
MKGEHLVDELSSNTVVQLKVMCKEHGLSTAGKKAEIISRLDEFLNEESLSMDDEADAVPLPEIEEEEILIAEFLEADLIEEELPHKIASISSPNTLMDQIKQPKVAAVLITLLLATGGWYWYVSNQLEPFTADDLRYGDSIEYSILNGDLDVTDGFIDLVMDNLDSEDDVCRLHLQFEGEGSSSVTEGGSNELEFEFDNDLLGAVRAKGSMGLDWLTVEKKLTHNFDKMTISRHLSNTITDCSSFAEGADAQMSLQTTTWTEISEQEIIATKADWSLNVKNDNYQGSTMSFGVGGLLGSLESAAPGVLMVFSPVEIREVIGTSLIETGVTGTSMGWEWRVIGPDMAGDEPAWKIALEHKEIRDNCLGHARVTMWVVADSPWAISQNVDVKITGKDGDRSSCGAATQILGDMILPKGTLTLKLDIFKHDLNRGTKLLDMGVGYDSLPSAGHHTPTSKQLQDWGDNELHLPDQSSLRQYPLEVAASCIPFLSEAVAARAALDDDGYIWRAIDNRSSTKTTWNISWVNSDPNSGWVKLDISGSPSSENCTYIGHGSHNNNGAHNRNEIPPALNISMMEDDLTDRARFPVLSGSDGFFTSTGQYQPETRIGHLVVTPNGDYSDWINRFKTGDTGATTLDLSRNWNSDGWSNTLTLAMDATSGQVIGWNLYQSK